MAGETQEPGSPAGFARQPAGPDPAASRIAANFDRVDWWSFALTMAKAVAGYWLTLAPGVTLEGSGLMATGAAYAGVPKGRISGVDALIVRLLAPRTAFD